MFDEKLLQTFGLITNCESLVADFADEEAKGHDLSVDSVENRLEIISLAWIFTVEEIEKTKHERLVDVPSSTLKTQSSTKMISHCVVRKFTITRCYSTFLL